MLKYKFIIFDKDGTICWNKNDHNNFINHWNEQELIPGVAGKCKEVRDVGIELGVASNQGGVAFGYMNGGVAYSVVAMAAEDIGAQYHTHCPYHPEGKIEGYVRDDWLRKPRPGMLLTLMVEAQFEPYETLFVGDRDEDYQAAKRAGCDFMWAWEFFDREPPDQWEAPSRYLGED
jgi:D-glycero-D-manno-heptose 1,7-bisphosphate phosphatase